MAEYTTDKIRNVVLLSHSGAGKTSLIEAMLFKAGAIKQQGSVTQGNSVGDYSADEIERKTTINTKIMNLNWGNCRVNIIDTPGFA
ncbi:MAG: GTP-binding protein, partial [Candidatus Omnitrophica bacterium]|nr:GTP-binding protein [Candidatus Omnitrophota bacterium]